jgi:FkbM family methyltransferase
VAKGYGFVEAVRAAIPIAQHLAAQPKWVATGCGDHAMFVDPTDKHIGSSVYHSGAYSRQDVARAVEVLAAHGRLRRNSVFVDVGANIGTHTLYALRSGFFDRAIAVEPEPANLALLRANIALNRLADRVAIHGVAAGAAPGTARLHIDEINRGAHSVLRRELPLSVEVPMVRLDDIVKNDGLDRRLIGIVWTDVEGSEPECVAGMPELLAASVPLVLEFNVAKYGPAKTLSFCDELALHYPSFAILAEDRPGIRPIADLPGIPIPPHGFVDIVVF